MSATPVADSCTATYRSDHRHPSLPMVRKQAIFSPDFHLRTPEHRHVMMRTVALVTAALVLSACGGDEQTARGEATPAADSLTVEGAQLIDSAGVVGAAGVRATA